MSSPFSMKSRLFSSNPNRYFDALNRNGNENEAKELEKGAASRVGSSSPYSMQATFRRRELVTDGNYDDE